MDTLIKEVEWLEPRVAEILSRGGISTLYDLAFSSLQSIMALGLCQEECHKIRELAISSLTRAYIARDLIERAKKAKVLTSGSTALDRLMKGGIRMGALTHVSGPSRSGKTQLCLQLCLSAFRNGLRTIFVDTKGTFRPERLLEMAKASELDVKELFQWVLVRRASMVAEQMNLPPRIAEFVRERRVGLAIFDTLADNFVYEYGGEATLIERQSLLSKHLHDLALLASEEGIAVVTTGGVREAIMGGRKEVGGQIPSQLSHARLMLDRVDHSVTASLLDPWEGMARIRITESGISDAS